MKNDHKFLNEKNPDTCRLKEMGKVYTFKYGTIMIMNHLTKEFVQA